MALPGLSEGSPRRRAWGLGIRGRRERRGEQEVGGGRIEQVLFGSTSVFNFTSHVNDLKAERLEEPTGDSPVNRQASLCSPPRGFWMLQQSKTCLSPQKKRYHLISFTFFSLFAIASRWLIHSKRREYCALILAFSSVFRWRRVNRMLCPSERPPLLSFASFSLLPSLLFQANWELTRVEGGRGH